MTERIFQMKVDVEKELAEKRHQLKLIADETPESYKGEKQRTENMERLQFEISNLEKKLSAVDEQIQAKTAEEMAEKRKAIIQKAESLKAEKETLLSRLAAINVGGQKLREEFEANVPVKRILTESKQILHWEREVEENKIAGFDGRGNAITKKEFRHEENTSDALPYRIELFRKQGWRLKPGQQIVPEELTPENSVLRPTVGVPELFDVFVQREE